jgi:hypothetical protein
MSLNKQRISVDPEVSCQNMPHVSATPVVFCKIVPGTILCPEAVVLERVVPMGLKKICACRMRVSNEILENSSFTEFRLPILLARPEGTCHTIDRVAEVG